jgi:3-dehydroquinate synthetase
MAHDKKARNGRLTLILSRGIGEAFIERDADIPALTRFLDKETDQPS